jgi:hypothetical protein
MHTVQLPASAGAQCFHIDLTNETPLTIAAIVIQALKRGNITEVTFVSFYKLETNSGSVSSQFARTCV